ncbi:MAG: DNA topoisomerase IB [Actinobacteria bacterium]|nr:DNA topoisomerase IB [Actinomycetota bacterium]
MTVTSVLPVVSELPPDAPPDQHAEVVGLVYVADDEPGISRVRRGKGWSFHGPDGTVIPDGPERERCLRLAIPPAWTDVWICRDPDGHLQATGYDEAGRKQYRYHDLWREVRDATKFHRMRAFREVLPSIREAVDRDLRRRSLSREKVLALVVALLDETLIRVGNDEYARTNESYGLTTLLREHVDVDGTTVRFAFPAKSGQEREYAFRDRRLARQVAKCADISGPRLFAYLDADERWHAVDSGAVNAYLREVSGDDFTAKDFRTWGGTSVVARSLRELGPPQSAADAEKNILAAIDAAAEQLGNTRAVCRASYVDPRVPKAYRFDRFDEAWDDDDGTVDRLSPAERAVGRILEMDLPRSSDLESLLAASVDVEDE